VRRRKAGYEPPFDTRENRIGTVRYETDNGREHVEPRGTTRERAITCGEPADRLNPAVVEAMKEVDIDILREFPKPLTDDAVRDAAERTAAVTMLTRRRKERGEGSRWTLGADKGYDTADFVDGVRALGVTPHVAQNTANRRSAIDGRTASHHGYAVSQRKRKRVEEIFGWMKTVGGGRKLRYIGRQRNGMWLTFTAAAFNLVRMANIEAGRS
jgi:hypothetical protein